MSSGQHHGGELLQFAISCENGSGLAASEREIETVVNGVLQVLGQCQRFEQKGLIIVEVIHQRTGIHKQILGFEIVQALGSLQFPESISHFGLHECWCQHPRGALKAVEPLLR